MNDPKGYETKRRYLKTIRDLKAKNARYKTALENVEKDKHRSDCNLGYGGCDCSNRTATKALKPEGSE